MEEEAKSFVEEGIPLDVRFDPPQRHEIPASAFDTPDNIFPAAQERDRVRTGLPGFDNQLGGGIPWGTAVLVASTGSHAPRLLCEHVVRSNLEEGRRVVYYGIERPRRETLPRLSGPHPNLEYVDAYGSDLPLDAPLRNRLGVGLLPGDVVEDLRTRLVSDADGRPFLVVVDSLTSLADAIGTQAAGEFLRVLSALVKTGRGIALVLHEREVLEERFDARAAFACDGIVEFGVHRQGFGVYTYLSVPKLLGAPKIPLLLLCRETDEGLWLESTRRVF